MSRGKERATGKQGTVKKKKTEFEAEDGFEIQRDIRYEEVSG